MQYAYLSNSVDIKTVSEDAKKGVFEIEGLYTGYGLTIGNALRRVLLSSLPGAAVTQFKIKNIPHEFSSIPGVKEDVIEIGLNLKNMRFRMHVDEPRILTIKAKGPKAIKGADIKTDDQIDVVTQEFPIATLTSKSTEFDAEITVEKGLGYVATEVRNSQKLPVGVIAVDSLFSPVIRANYTIENMRVGARTDYDRLRVELETDGTISPSSALHKAINILKDHFEKISAIPVQEFPVQEASKKKKRTKKAKS